MSKYKTGTQVQAQDGWQGRVLQTAIHTDMATWESITTCTCQDADGNVRLIPEAELMPA